MTHPPKSILLRSLLAAFLLALPESPHIFAQTAIRIESTVSGSGAPSAVGAMEGNLKASTLPALLEPLNLSLSGSAAEALAPAPTATRGAQVIVVGGGPVGLAAAIEAKLGGAASVLVVEKRGAVRTRTQNLGLFRSSLDSLARLDVPFEKGKNATVMKGSAYLMRRRIDPELANDDPAGLENDDLVAFMSINTLEKSLLAKARRMGVELMFHAEVTSLDMRPDHVLVEANTRGGETAYHGDYVIVADGARSKTLATLGLESKPVVPDATRLLNAVFATRGSGELKYFTDKDGVSVVRQGGLRTSVLVELPPGLVFADDRERRAYYRKRARLVGLSGPLLRQPLQFDVRLESVDRHVVGGRVFVIGDAGRKTHPYSGQGVNLGLRDAMRVGRLIRNLLEAPPAALRDRLLRRFDRETMRATHATHAFVKRMIPFPR